ncbi:hypothetical protein FS749_006820 [Ceratobasidium sp. UAMH 11750]|nr:hypothetical protein FS749_006820 [Ceratobasidium sp. UAMH 11750]
MEECANWLKDNYDELQAALELANRRNKLYYNQRHSKPQNIRVGDKVWLDSSNIKTDRPSQKLAAKKLGPFKVKKLIGSHAFHLKLPHTMKVYPVFHVSKILLKEEDPFQCEPIPQPPIVTPEGEEEWEVEEILSSRKRRGEIQYLVKWLGYGPEGNTWEPYEHLGNAKETLAKYHRRHPRAPKDPQA